MTRDYRHGPARSQPYQRQSQRVEADSADTAGRRRARPIGGWLLALGLSAALLGAYWVVTHFAQQGVKSEKVEEAQTTDDSSEASISAPSEAGLTPAESDKAVTSEETDAGDARAPSDRVVEALPNPHASQPAAKPEEVHYTFYRGLAEAEVVVEAMPLSVELAVPHYIQAGSFGAKRYAMAEQKRLQRHGQALTVSELTTDQGTYYRLRMGPFTDRLALNKQRNELRRLGVDTLVIKDRSAD
ncbi:MAG: SPOR domain-containing protein [Hydrogenovibrio sp.]|uniref:SPOR domain-containing protein n=1 Tax=Hydrogenovibrio sp. TaxID=2065821 RepID=UPI0028706D25|nr:SPOR domain-containing protein [Hydrogenovibrio sp.]MDR9498373.1 SPOR domain-containing protein [Hydrogenovibrio sp.]